MNEQNEILNLLCCPEADRCNHRSPIPCGISLLPSLLCRGWIDHELSQCRPMSAAEHAPGSCRPMKIQKH